MPATPKHPEAVAAEEEWIPLEKGDGPAVRKLKKEMHQEAAAIITKHMAPAKAKAVEAAYREGWWDGHEHRKMPGPSCDWPKSKVAAALGQTDEVKT